MLHTFVKSCVGYNHIKDRLPCQDYSALYKDNARIIITCCDGHGGKKYIRSHIGSHMASNSIINVFNSVTSTFFRLNNDEIENKIKLSILCEWNKLIESYYSSNPIKKSEIVALDEDDILCLKNDFVKAYGTTLTGALLIANKLLIIKIGDTECFAIKKGELINLFENEDEPVANITYSLCQDDAFKHLQVKVVDFKDIDGVILCSDGLTSPYQSYDNFKNSFINPFVRKLIKEKSYEHIENFVEELALKLGVGDDVSLSFIIKDNLAIKHYT